MEQNPPDREKKKAAYVKPEVTKVLLRPEEAVLGFCKTPTSAGPGSLTDCTTCSNIGS